MLDRRISAIATTIAAKREAAKAAAAAKKAAAQLVAQTQDQSSHIARDAARPQLTPTESESRAPGSLSQRRSARERRPTARASV